jgi:hypothetical protein
MIPISDIAITLASQEDRFPKDIVYLILELKSNDRVLQKVDLSSRESTPGTWATDTHLAL